MEKIDEIKKEAEKFKWKTERLDGVFTLEVERRQMRLTVRKDV